LFNDVKLISRLKQDGAVCSIGTLVATQA